MKRNEALGTLDHPEPVLDFVRRARERLSTVAPVAADGLPLGGEHELSPDIADLIRDTPQVPAAVLVPVIARKAPTILLTQRAAGLPTPIRSQPRCARRKKRSALRRASPIRLVISIRIFPAPASASCRWWRSFRRPLK